MFCSFPCSSQKRSVSLEVTADFGTPQRELSELVCFMLDTESRVLSSSFTSPFFVCIIYNIIYIYIYVDI